MITLDCPSFVCYFPAMFTEFKWPLREKWAWQALDWMDKQRMKLRDPRRLRIWHIWKREYEKNH